MSKWGRLRRRRATDDMRGVYSENHLCIDCGFDTAPGCPTRAEAERAFARGANGIKLSYDARSELYIVHDWVWKAAGMEPWGGCLCIGCLENRIGRKLTPDDFPDHVFNTDLPGTPRLLERQGRYDPLGDFNPMTAPAVTVGSEFRENTARDEQIKKRSRRYRGATGKGQIKGYIRS